MCLEIPYLSFIASPKPFFFWSAINYALNKAATQSSVYYDSKGIPASADKAVDGNADPLWQDPTYPGSCACTLATSGVRASWQVDLGSVVQVSYVRITNRDCCREYWLIQTFNQL